MRKLAYPINFKNEGYYVLMNITMKPEEVEPMAKLMNITEGIVRQMFVKKKANNLSALRVYLRRIL